MQIEKSLAKKAKQHTVYRLQDGTRVPGTTTILGVINKPALIPWANKLGLQGIEVGKYQDVTAKVGTCCHAMIESHLKGEAFDDSEYDKTTLNLAENGYLKYLDWEAKHTLEDVHAELPLVSEELEYGGTIDLYCKLDGEYTLVDFKTSASGIYSEMEWQVAGAYEYLLSENGYNVDRVMILRLGRSDKDDMEVKTLGNWPGAWLVFTTALRLYREIANYERDKKGEK